jgi:peptidoglycan/xylan/chitin deacetylase (PgdA/CDA1 family)
VKEALARLLAALGLGALFRWRNRRRLLVLMYHGVVERKPEVPCWHLLPVEAFRRQMAFLARRYRVLPLEDALARLSDGTLPRKACAITFDDGLRNVATVAGPVLASHGLHATVFLATSTVGTRDALWADRLHLALVRAHGPDVDASALDLGRLPLGTATQRADASRALAEGLKRLPRAEKDARLAEILASIGTTPDLDPGPFEALSWDDVSAMAATGRFSFGPHTIRHEILSRCEDEVVTREVSVSTTKVAVRLRRAPVVFAYPNGREEDFDARARDAVSRAGMSWALSTTEGLAGNDSDPLALPRIGVGGDLSLARFSLLCSGALAALRSAS